MKLLILRLEGMLQSWGDRPHWDHRGTAEMPTKSGIVGLLGCAMGIGRGDSRLRELGERFRWRCAPTGALRCCTIIRRCKACGANFPTPRAACAIATHLVTPKDYLEDACYTVFIAAPEETLEACAAALRHPVWTPCLGRRSCPPTRPLLPLISEAYSSLEDAAHIFAGKIHRCAGPVQICSMKSTTVPAFYGATTSHRRFPQSVRPAPCPPSI